MKEVSRATIGRIPRYLQYLKNAPAHTATISATTLAHALGLGSCWIHRAKEEFEQPEFRHLLADLGVEGEYEGIGHCVLGYPAGSAAPAAPRKDGRVFWVE